MHTALMLQVMPMYNAEVAPPHLRGGMNILFQWFVTFGILCAGLINYGCDFIDTWGWRLALGLAAIPGAIVFLGGLVMPESPSSLIERGHFEKARVVSACCHCEMRLILESCVAKCLVPAANVCPVCCTCFPQLQTLLSVSVFTADIPVRLNNVSIQTLLFLSSLSSVLLMFLCGCMFPSERFCFCLHC